MYILGINAYHADSSAALLRDGQLIAATEEERFTRVKHWAGFPGQAIQFCLNEAGIRITDVDHIAIGRDRNAKLFKKLWYVVKNPSAGINNFRSRWENATKVSSLESEFVKLFPGANASVIKSKICQIEHHRAHLASAFYASPFTESALLSIDGSGDFSTTMLGHGIGNNMNILDSVDFPHSIGLFYTALTQYLGFPHYGDEYKIMGLAPYGKPTYVEAIRKLVIPLPNGLFRLDLDYFDITKSEIITYGQDHKPVVARLFSAKIETLLGPARKGTDELLQSHKDMAASIQQVTEEIITHILNGLQKRTGLDNICVAGGVAQNSVMNGKITRLTSFKNVYIPSAGHDAGISMGAALFQYYQVLKLKRSNPIWSAYTGAHFSNEQIESILDSRKLQYTRYADDELYQRVADCLINGGVVGWFTGKAEFGPRALGGRSILADPRREDAKDLLNQKIKRRESFRPFAPSILEDYVGEYFEITDRVPFMEKVFPIRPEKRSQIPAVTHVDGSGRLQSVNKDLSPRYYHLINTFRQKTGVPILLNTSFNENEPIVNNPDQAIDCYLRTSMDMLVLENCILSRN
ncbi:MAG: carbamoyltransferase [Bacteroidota bacterium]|nr:carbamoyltransferase [Bacteroidota bacterium]